MLLRVKGSPRFPEVSDPDLPWLRHLVDLVGEMGGRGELVELNLVDDATIRQLNRDYRGRDSATDVLSFHYGQEAPGLAAPEEDPLGEIMISVETARNQAVAEGHSWAEEISVLVIHGIHHMMGFDHETPDEAAAMLEAEEPWRQRVNEFFRTEGERS